MYLADLARNLANSALAWPFRRQALPFEVIQLAVRSIDDPVAPLHQRQTEVRIVVIHAESLVEPANFLKYAQRVARQAPVTAE